MLSPCLDRVREPVLEDPGEFEDRRLDFGIGHAELVLQKEKLGLQNIIKKWKEIIG